MSSQLISGVVTRSTGSWYDVVTDNHGKFQCRIVGKFRLKGFKITNPVAVGDRVKIKTEDEEGIASIYEIEERDNYVIRQSPRKKHQLHLLASNIDQAFLIVTIVHPNIKQGFIDRFLMMTEPYNIPVQIIFNKKDLYNKKSFNIYRNLKDIYEKVGYHCHLVSAVTMEGIEPLYKILENKLTLIAGQSGVGKSTLINALIPGFKLKTEEISDYTGKGQHTTTFAEMFEINPNTFIIDTPGIKTLSFSHFEPVDVAHNFKEIFELSSDCKFYDCLHIDEPKCAVKNAIEADEISELRYINYLTIIDEIKEQNYWERHTDM